MYRLDRAICERVSDQFRLLASEVVEASLARPGGTFAGTVADKIERALPTRLPTRR
jgi:hypothetical protein